MFYLKIAVTNIRKNWKNHFPYILTCVLTIMIFYILDAICKNDGVKQIVGAEKMNIILNMASGVTAIFSVMILFYTNNFLIKQRKKEFGLYQVLGMDKYNLVKILWCENYLTAMISISMGLFLGFLLGKLMFLILLKMIHFSIPLAFTIEPIAIFQTFILFTGIFLIAFCYNSFQLRKVKPIELLHSDKMGEKEPKSKWGITIIGILAIVAGYGIALRTEAPLSALGNFFGAAILVMVGTYALFIGGSIFLLKALKRNKSYYYHPKHFATVSGMLYRMKQNAVGLANICIMSTIVMVLISVTASLYMGMKDVLDTRFPSDCHVQIEKPDNAKITKINQIIKEELRKEKVKAEDQQEFVSLSFLSAKIDGDLTTEGLKNYAMEDLRVVFVITLDSFNQLEGKKEVLQQGEILFYSPIDDFQKERIQIGEESYNVSQHLDFMKIEKFDTSTINTSVYIVVPDMETISFLADKYNYRGSEAVIYHQYLNPKGNNIACTKAIEKISEKLVTMEGVYFEWRDSAKESYYQLYGGLLFIGVFVGFLFLMGTVLIIYYKQIAEGLDDRERFQILKKVGMSQKEVKQTIRNQVLIVFFLPLGAAVVHVSAAFKVLTKLMKTLDLNNIGLEAVCTSGTILIFAVFYVLVFIITSREYYRIVK